MHLIKVASERECLEATPVLVSSNSQHLVASHNAATQ